VGVTGGFPPPVFGLDRLIGKVLRLFFLYSDFGGLVETHDRACQGFAPSATTLFGRDGLVDFLTDLRSAIPDARYRLHHWIELREEGINPRIALRWSVTGTHSGSGRFGPPTGAPLVILAISHHELQRGYVIREYHGIDELSIWKQIAAGRD